MKKVLLVAIDFILFKNEIQKGIDELFLALKQTKSHIVVFYKDEINDIEYECLKKLDIKSIVQLKHFDCGKNSIKYDISQFKRNVYEETKYVLESQNKEKRKDNIILIGRSQYSIHIGRVIGIKTILVGYQKERLLPVAKYGATYLIVKLEEILNILTNPISHLLCLEVTNQPEKSKKSIILINNSKNGRLELVVTLGRQDVGSIDPHAQGWRYHMISNKNRQDSHLKELSEDISYYLRKINEDKRFSWDYISYMADKETTIPRNKMKDIFDYIQTDIPKIELFNWKDTGGKSLRNSPDINTRKEYVDNFLRFHKEDIDITNKNIIIIDDQITTGATAEKTIHILKERGVKNILFIALFLMIENVGSNRFCPKCGNELKIRYNRSRYSKFLSCFDTTGRESCNYAFNIV